MDESNVPPEGITPGQTHAGLLPLPTAQHGHKKLERDADAGPPLTRLRTGATLGDLAKECALFTVAPLFAAGGTMVNLLQEYMNAQGLSRGIYLVPLPVAVFDFGDLPNSEIWSRAIHACDRPLWEGLAYHIATAGMINRAQGFFARVVTQDIPVTDVVAVLKMNVVELPCPVVTVTTFSVDSNHGLLVFEPATNLPVDRPRLVRRAALPATIALGAAELQQAKKPYVAGEQLLRQKDKK